MGRIGRRLENEEIRRAFFDIGGFKAPGEDGFPAVFYQRNWDVVGKEVSELIKRLWEKPEGIVELNKTLLVLVPKVDSPEWVTQFRPIALCNVLYKGLTKILVRRLKGVMDRLVSPFQTSFVPGRNIQDNIIIAKEVAHMMQRMRSKKGYMVIKIDLEKAYDRLSLGFLMQVLEEIELPDNIVNIIHHCLYSVRMCLLWNGSRQDEFKPTRGIRQGDPLSPYLFVLAMEKLSHIIADSVESRRWKPVRVGRSNVCISHLLFADDLLLFCEASEEQLGNALECLDLFGKVSGQKINPSKTSIFFSRNVARDKQNIICGMGGFQRKEELGRYLGAHITQGRNSRAKFQFLIDKVQRKLSGWKTQSLALAGRITLVQSVTSQVMNFQMQHENIPVGVCNAVEKLQRNFIWGSDVDKKKLHAVSWEGVCKPKVEGGLGIRRLKGMNDALLGKVGWNLLAKPRGLCSQVLKAKYGRGANWLADCIVKQHDSSLWKNVTRLWPEVTKGIGWEVKDGKSVKFWDDRWLYGVDKLACCYVGDTGLLNPALTVNQTLTSDGSWNWAWLQGVLPYEVIQLIQAIPPPCSEDGDDKLVWRGGHGARFSVAQMYQQLSGDASMGLGAIWKSIWKVKTTRRIQVFLWLAVQDRLLTAARRARLIGGVPTCSRCGGGVEDLDHVLRSCPDSRRIWLALNVLKVRPQFFTEDMNCWFLNNLQTGKEWSVIFSVCSWMIWGWRNKLLFEEGFRMPERPVFAIQNYVRECVTSSTCFDGYGLRYGPRGVKWIFPDEQWVKLNFDGAARGCPGLASCGGVLRRSDGSWICGFVRKLGRCNALAAEIWGVVQGLRMAHDLGFPRVIAEGDSTLALHMIQEAWTQGKATDRTLNEWLRDNNKEMQIRFSHTFREGNSVADWLAHYSFNCNEDFFVFDSPPAGVIELLYSDTVGVVYPRFDVSL